MDQITNVLAAVGQFPQDDTVLARAAEIAHAHGARLTVVHVIDDISGFDLVPVDISLIQHQVRLIVQESLEAAIARVAIDLVEIDIHIETGSPSLRLIELINELNVDLVVMRAHQSDSIVDKIIGSTTDRVIRSAHTPVLVVKRPVTQAYQRVVVSIDTSDDSAVVAPLVAALFPLAKLQLIHVVQIPPQFEAAMLRAGSSQAVIANHREALFRKAKVSLRDLSKRLGNRPLRTVMRVVVGDPTKSLLRATWSPMVDLIVLGPGSTGRFRRALLGSVTQQVLRAASCDVLIFRTTLQDADK